MPSRFRALLTVFEMQKNITNNLHIKKTTPIFASLFQKSTTDCSMV